MATDISSLRLIISIWVYRALSQGITDSALMEQMQDFGVEACLSSYQEEWKIYNDWKVNSNGNITPEACNEQILIVLVFSNFIHRRGFIKYIIEIIKTSNKFKTSENKNTKLFFM